MNTDIHIQYIKNSFLADIIMNKVKMSSKYILYNKYNKISQKSISAAARSRNVLPT